MTLREVREYYGRTTRVLSFMNLFFMLVLAGLGIYISDVAADSEGAENIVYCLYTIFVTGSIVAILQIITCIVGRKESYESAFKIRRTISVLAFVIGAFSLGTMVFIALSTISQWDSYSKAVFFIDMTASALEVIFSILVFWYARTGAAYYDDKKNAKDIPENMSVAENNRKYGLMLGICHVIFAVMVFLLAKYFASEINIYGELDLSDYSGYANIYDFISGCGLVVSAALLIISVMAGLFIKKKSVYLSTVIIMVFNCVLQLIFAVYSVYILIAQDFVKAQYPDISYVVFSLFLVVISMIMAWNAVKIISKSNLS